MWPFKKKIAAVSLKKRKRFYLLIFRERAREGKRGRETSV